MALRDGLFVIMNLLRNCLQLVDLLRASEVAGSGPQRDRNQEWLNMVPTTKNFVILGLIVSLIGTAGLGWAVEAEPISEGSWTMIVLPDTQHYCDTDAEAEIFYAQTQWIVAHQTSHNIKMVLHEGDLTNNNTAAQFARAKTAMDYLDAAEIPYTIAPGNHDYGPNGNSSTRDSLFNSPTYFGPGSAYANQDNITFYEAGKTDNSYITFSAGPEGEEEDWLVFSTEFGPRNEVVTWMDGIATAHPNHNLVLNTHAYLYNDSNRYDWDTYNTAQKWSPHSYTLSGTINDGQELWDGAVKNHANWKFTFNGHVLNSGTGWLGSYGDNGNIVHQILSNFQMKSYGGGGYLRIMEFKDDGDTVDVSSYSPYVGAYRRAYDQEFILKMSEMPPPLITRVSGANLSVPTTTSDSSSVWTITGSGPGMIETMSPANVADVSLKIGGVPTHRNKGVMLASVRQNSRNGYYGTVEVSHINYFSMDNSTLQIATSRAHYGGEYNVNVAVGFFPFADAWIGGHVTATGALWEHYGVSDGNVTRTATGRYRVSVDGIDSRSDGMLFAIGGNNGHNFISTAPRADGSAWDIAIRDNTADDFVTFESAKWSFVYVDYDAPGLVGGRIAADGSLSDLAGSFLLTHPSTGAYQITIPGYTPDDGVLLLTVAGMETVGIITAPANNIISYEAYGNDFLVNVRDRGSSSSPLEDCEFVFAFLAFDNQLIPAVPGDANYDGEVDAADAAILAENWGEYDATWAMGDFNVDGVIDPADAAILAAHWGYPGSESTTSVPEPTVAVPLLGALFGLGLLRRRSP